MNDNGIGRNVWWLFALRGVLLLFVAAAFLFHPMAAITGTVWVIGIFWFVSGIFTLVGLLFNRTQWGWKLFSGLLSLIVGSWIAFPGSVVEAVGNAVAFKGAIAIIWGIGALIIGFITIVTAIQSKSWSEGLFGAFQVLVGIIITGNLFVAMALLPFMIAVFAIATGLVSLYMAYKVFKLRNRTPQAIG